MGIVTTKDGKSIPMKNRMSGVEILSHPDVKKLKKYEGDTIRLVDPETNTHEEVRPDRDYEVPDGTQIRREGQHSRGSTTRSG